MSKKDQLKKVLMDFAGTDPTMLEGFKAFDEGVAKLKSQLQEKIKVNTLEEVNTTLDDFRKKIDIEPLRESVSTLSKEFSKEVDNLVSQLSQKVSELVSLTTDTNSNSVKRTQDLNDEISLVRGSIKDLIAEKNKDLDKLRKELTDADAVSDRELIKQVGVLNDKIDSGTKTFEVRLAKDEKELDTISKSIPTVKAELLTAINNRGGGGANRNIAIGGNYSILSKYTDINLKPGSNISFTVVKNDTTKYTEITIAGTGGGSVGGTVRQIQTLSASSTIGTLTGTDQVYLCNAGIQVVLPTAVGDTNLYTIKNVSNSSILIVGTIDDDTNGVIMPVKYTSVDIISNNTDWDIT